MPKNSGPTNRNFGLNHANGKGDKSRVTDVRAYRENFDEIDWRASRHYRLALRPGNRTIPIIHKRDEEAEYDWRMGL